MRRALILLAAAAIIVAACGGDDGTTTTGGEAAELPPADAGPVFIAQTELTLDGDTLRVTVTGDLPTPCHAPQTTISTSRPVTEGGDTPRTRVDVQVWSERQGDEACAEVLEPFEVSVSAAVTDGGADVYVNDELAGSVG